MKTPCSRIARLAFVAALLARFLAGAALAQPISFTKVTGVATGARFTVLEVGPDGKLYGGTVLGEIRRWTINPDGTLGGQQTITSIQTANGGERAIIGLRFDPASTAGNLILWVTHSGAPLTGSADWLGKITRLSGPNLATVQDYVVNLPRSIRDHMTNGIDFGSGEPTVLYVVQGSNSAMGAPDSGWGNRPERLLSAAVLRVDLAAITNPPLDVKTEEGGAYDPFAPGAPLTIFGSGLRNCYDLVWHSNGQLYVPCNGSASGGNTPATPNPLPLACSTRRLDLAENGPYTGPSVTGIAPVMQTQNEYLFRVEEGGYYGHPNPQRCEWVMNGGNPTTGTDVAQVNQYPVGTQPDRNWRGAAYDFGQSYSPDGIIEYRSNAFGGALQGKLLVTRFSNGNDVIVLTPGGPNLDIVNAQTGISGMTGFIDPLGIVEHVATGNVYVAEYEGQRVTLLRADASATGCVTAADCLGTLPACGAFACVAATCQVTPVGVGAPCRSTAGVCDVPETCDGVATTCPADGFAAAGTVCRAGSGDACDPSESCTGSGAACPADIRAAAGTPCGGDGDACTTDACDGLGTCAHVLPPGLCSDGDLCTTDVCDPGDGSCSHGSLGGQPCDTGLSGACAGGVTTCQAGTVSCQQTTQPSPEQCNNAVDDDCDGDIDDADSCGPTCLPENTVSVTTQTRKTGVKLSVKVDGDKVQTKGSFVVPADVTFQPGMASVTLVIGDNDGAYYTGGIPSGGFVAASSGRSFKFKDRYQPFENAGLKTAKFSLASDRQTVKYAFKAQTLNLPEFTTGTGTVIVKVGDMCFVDTADQCLPAGSGVSCK